MYKYLLDIFKERALSVDLVAEKLGILKVNLYKKINGDVKFSLKEAQILADLLDMTIDSLFYAHPVSISETSEIITSYVNKVNMKGLILW